MFKAWQFVSVMLLLFAIGYGAVPLFADNPSSGGDSPSACPAFPAEGFSGNLLSKKRGGVFWGCGGRYNEPCSLPGDFPDPAWVPVCVSPHRVVNFPARRQELRL
jgi:hypothetical protein